MREGPEDQTAGLASSLEAAGALIESLEEEVAGLRRDLDAATAALRVAQEQVGGRADAGREAEELRAEISDLKRRHSDEQLRMSNAHINEVANVRRALEEQRRADVEAAASETRVEALKEEFARERAALQDLHKAEIEALRTDSEIWEEELRTKYREQEERHEAELEAARREDRGRIEELENSRDEEIERRISEERAAHEERHEAALKALKSAAAGRELELQRDYQAVVETQQTEIESLRAELDSRKLQADEARKEERKEVKALAESREKELRRSQATRLAETREAAERRVEALRAQREADNRALRARHAEEISALRRDYEEKLAGEDERRRSETWALEERLHEAGLRLETERRVYGARMKELEASRLAEKAALEKDHELAVDHLRAEISAKEDRIEELEEALQETGETPEPPPDAAPEPSRAEPPPADHAQNGSGDPEGEPAGRTEEVDAERILAEERIEDLEARLARAEEEAKRNAEELDRATESLRLLSEPGRRLREGLALFNESEHARVVASISRSFGLPRVHADLDGGTTGKPTLTLLWGDVAWRRYVSDPSEGVPEPRVYLAGTGDDPEEVPRTERQPNARMDAQGRLTLGVQAR
ncbi:hypothetical protein GBA63_08960 [Rubrobacter tropicus]|uniref:Trichohyalin n=1 Tax=Rubrobacter tropicus TaxID=2653851 RepID=A0A6G8Q8J9_9ACTN|nr:hypothetical protein [Rubrobacter tropicus]QIN82762.1 hypothetical protein GBA63_08960 [Rubrobacter tropicus]